MNNRSVIKNKYHVLLIGGGSYSPGGVNIHVRRLSQYIQNKGLNSLIIAQNEPAAMDPFDNILYLRGNKLRKFLQLILLLISLRYEILHIHVSKFSQIKFALPLILLAAFRRKRVLTIHSGDFVREINSRKLEKVYIRCFLIYFHKILPLNLAQKSFLEEQMELNDKVHKVVSSAIMPVKDDRSEKNDDLISKFLQWRKKFDNVLLISGIPYSYYNFNFAIDFLEAQKKVLNIGLVICLYSRGDSNFKNNLIKKIENNKNIILFEDLTENEHLLLLKNVDFFLRPTSVDSVGIVVSEAISLGVPVIASDVCLRPNGTILFRNNDKSDFTKKLLYAIQNKEKVKAAVKDVNLQNPAAEIYKVYKNLLDNI